MRLESSLPQVTEMLRPNKESMGGWDTGLISGLFGIWMTGKSIFALQESFKMAKEMKKGILIIDSEGGDKELLGAWRPVFEKRFDYKPQLEIVRMKPRMQDILAFHGMRVNIPISEKGKPQTIPMEELEKNPLEEEYLKKNFGIIIYDSVTMLYSRLVPILKIFPARSAAVGLLMGYIQCYATDYDLMVIGIHHVAKDPTNKWARPKMVGGKPIYHNTKVSLYMRQCGYKKAPNIREISLFRYYNKQEWSESFKAILDDGGYRGLTDVELSKITKGEKEVKEGEKEEEDKQ